MFFENLINQSPREHNYFRFSEKDMQLISAGVKTLHAVNYTQSGTVLERNSKSPADRSVPRIRFHRRSGTPAGFS